jgi:dTDP-4-amino-4,6-dideoxygalactose transaminase
MGVTESIAARLLRLPLWIGISEAQQAEVVRVLTSAVT